MKKMLKRRSGFTLVELLIVIIIIGILAGAMLLVAGSGTDKAEATKIVSNLRGLKSASLMYYADKTQDAEALGAGDHITELSPYMDRELQATGASFTYKFNVVKGTGGASDTWYVGIEGASGKNYPSSGTQGKLAEMADSSGLYQSTTSADTYVTGDKIYMRAR